MRGENRDYIPKREKGAESRMDDNASLQDGLSGRIESKRRGAHYRDHFDKGQEDMGAKYADIFDFD